MRRFLHEELTEEYIEQRDAARFELDKVYYRARHRYRLHRESNISIFDGAWIGIYRLNGKEKDYIVRLKEDEEIECYIKAKDLLERWIYKQEKAIGGYADANVAG